MQKRRIPHYILLGFVILIAGKELALALTDQDPQESFGETYLMVEDFGADGTDQQDDAPSIQDAIDYSHHHNNETIRLAGNKTYILQSGLILREGVSLESGLNTTIKVVGDFRVIEMEGHTSIINGKIEIADPSFSSEVVYVDGKQQIWSSSGITIDYLTLYNSSESRRGTGILFSADNSGEFISFVNVMNSKVIGFNKGIFLHASTPEKSDHYNFINGNRFLNLTLEDCITCIELHASSTVPNEISGNMFRNLQVQLSAYTDKVFKVSGSNNVFDAMIWDVHLLTENRHLIEMTDESFQTFMTTNLPENYLVDHGQSNHYALPLGF